MLVRIKKVGSNMGYSKEEILNSFPTCDRWCSRCRNLGVYPGGDGYTCKYQFGDQINRAGITADTASYAKTKALASGDFAPFFFSRKPSTAREIQGRTGVQAIIETIRKKILPLA